MNSPQGMHVKTTQEILNAAIASGHYRKELPAPAMCLSLLKALEDGVITHKEYKQAVIEIQNYIQGFTFLSTALYHNELPHDRPHQVALYQNWDDRPILTKRRSI